MPYEMRKNKNKFCVYNKDTGENKGCSDTLEEAKAHMRALYAHAGPEAKKETTTDVDALVEEAVVEFFKKEAQPVDETKEEKCMGCGEYNPTYGATTFEELDTIREAQRQVGDTNSLLYDLQNLQNSVIVDPEVTDKGSAIERLAGAFKSRFNAIFSKNKQAVKEVTPPGDDILIWKEIDGAYHWIARYSNNFRDRDNPPEIISDASHRGFVERVEKGITPLPELWLWHRPEWKFGNATWVAYDDVGFALAGGAVDKDKEALAEWLMTQKDIKVSHGMPPSSIEKDVNDQSVIVRHDTREISPLPGWAAANQLTGFIVLDQTTKENHQEAKTMPIPADKKEALLKMGLSADVLARIETANAVDASKAKEAGIESKEVKEAPVAPVAPTEPAKVPEAPTQPETKDDTKKEETPVQPTAPTETPVTRQEIADGIVSVINPLVDRIAALENTLTTFNEAVKELAKSDEQKVKEMAAGTPTASLVSLLAKSVIGRTETSLDKEAPLAKLGPARPTQVNKSTGIPFLDDLIAPKQ